MKIYSVKKISRKADRLIAWRKSGQSTHAMPFYDIQPGSARHFRVRTHEWH
ncbi:MAG: hypothetical protein QX196_10755 [Methylococcaceae bacterium]